MGNRSKGKGRSQGSRHSKQKLAATAQRSSRVREEPPKMHRAPGSGKPTSRPVTKAPASNEKPDASRRRKPRTKRRGTSLY